MEKITFLLKEIVIKIIRLIDSLYTENYIPRYIRT